MSQFANLDDQVFPSTGLVCHRKLKNKLVVVWNKPNIVLRIAEQWNGRHTDNLCRHFVYHCLKIKKLVESQFLLFWILGRKINIIQNNSGMFNGLELNLLNSYITYFTMSVQYSCISKFDMSKCINNLKKVLCGIYNFLEGDRKINVHICFLQFFNKLLFTSWV